MLASWRGAVRLAEPQGVIIIMMGMVVKPQPRLGSVHGFVRATGLGNLLILILLSLAAALVAPTFPLLIARIQGLEGCEEPRFCRTGPGPRLLGGASRAAAVATAVATAVSMAWAVTRGGDWGFAARACATARGFAAGACAMARGCGASRAVTAWL